MDGDRSAPKPVVAIVGRPNVGKSALFNRLTRTHAAIVEAEPGVTRDRIYGEVEWAGRAFTLVDTGGIDVDAGRGDDIAAKTRRQAEIAISEADLVLFVVDARAGLTPADRDVADLLRRAARPVLVVANKVDGGRPDLAAEFFGLGLGEPHAVSAAHGLGTGDLLDAVLRRVDAPPVPAIEGAAPEGGEIPVEIRAAFVGRPNVGKSSLVNALLRDERVIVADAPGTTREAVDVTWHWQGQAFRFIDTGGMRRRARVVSPVERYSVIRGLRAINRSDVVCLVLEATTGVTDQDKKIAGYAHESGRAAVVVANKWDLVERDGDAAKRLERSVRFALGFMPYALFTPASARTGLGLARLPGLIAAAAREHRRRVPTHDLTALVRDAQVTTPAPATGGDRLKIFYATQVGVAPPSFLFFVNDPGRVHFSYRRHLENRLRAAFGFEGTPVFLHFRRRA